MSTVFSVWTHCETTPSSDLPLILCVKWLFIFTHATKHERLIRGQSDLELYQCAVR